MPDDAAEVNDAKPGTVVKKLRASVEAVKTGGVPRPAIACLGLTYKPDINDIRESPALAIIEQIANRGDCDVFVAEPNLSELPDNLKGKSHVRFETIDEAVRRSHIVALLVDHRGFYELDRSKLVGKQIVDTRGMWSRSS